MPATRLFTSESVTEGHPDKVCDQISDAVLDALLAKDPMARVACETCCTTGLVLVMGEISTNCYVDIPSIVRTTLGEIGYTRAKYGFDSENCAVMTAIDEQSPDIAMGVNRATDSGSLETGAGDQGMMFGFACDETPSYMPMALALSHTLCHGLADARKSGLLPWLRPDGKAQVTCRYENGRPVHIDTVVLSAQHGEDIDIDTLRAQLKEKVILPALPQNLITGDTRFLINPTGRFVLGGPHADSGLTGRKIIVDTYGGYAPHGGGAFSGKDPTKVDRSAAYAARHAALNVVAAGLASACQVSLAYAIGTAHPVQVSVDTRGTGKVSDEMLSRAVERTFDFRPDAIIERFGLRRPLYRQVAAYGHFGRPELALPWEALDATDALTAAVR
nr:methionine adenosyltransferase [bacterium]